MPCLGRIDSWRAAVAAGVFLLLLAGDFPSPANAAEPVDFSHDVAPILKRSCLSCHLGKEPKGELSMNTRESLLAAGAVVPGESGESSLAERIRSEDAELQMPPAGKPRLTAKEIETLIAWIDQGAAWEDGFRFEVAAYEPPLAPRQVELPPVMGGRDNPIDRILDAYWSERSLERPPPASDAEFLRRLRMDLVGLPPTPEELASFLADASPDKRSRQIAATLADSQAYAQHWLTFWNDLLRNDYVGTGYIDGGRKQITAWLYSALLSNKPYDAFVRELIAPGADAEGFINGIQWRGNVNASQVRPVQFAQSVSQVFLGINMKCASCHDSFIDRWKLDEAYGLAAVYSVDPLQIHRCDQPTGVVARAKWIFPELGDVDPSAPQPERLQQLARLMTHPENGRTTRTIVNRLWQRMMGRGIVHPVDAMHTPPWSADLLDFLASDLAQNGYDLKRTLALIAGSAAYQSRAALETAPVSAEEYVFRGPAAKRLTAEQFLDSIWRITAAGPSKPDAPVTDLRLSDPAQNDRPFVRAAVVKSDLLMRSLGRPNREQVVTTRPESLTMLEALDLANGEILSQTLKAGAANLLARNWPDNNALVDWLYAFALSRGPSPEERAVAVELLGESPSQEGVEDLLWTVFMLPEFQFVW